ncbi:MAG: prephenate dehydrogenase/arogenate dehydrogenase family protein [Nitrososphaerota archaeon]
MDIAVIGLGAFGRWLIEQFIKQDFRIKAYDVDYGRLENLESPNVIRCRTLEEAVESVDVVVVSIPVNVAGRVIIEVSKQMTRGVIVDVSSIKKPVYDIMKNLREDLKPVCIHPLFGPAAQHLGNERIALIPVRDSLEERRIVERLFPEVKIIEVDINEHDKLMTYILSLTHLLSIVVVDIIGEIGDMEMLEKLAGTSFKHMCKMLNATLTESLDTFTSILYYNDGTKQLSFNLLREFSKIARTISRGDYTVLKRLIEEKQEAYSRLEFMKRFAVI